jgi:transcription termination/antitermination protein NusG
MAFFALQILTGKEGRFLALADRMEELREGVRLWWPRRSLRIRRSGAWHESLAPIFPGYLFLQADTLPPQAYRCLRSISGFMRFLPSNDDILPMSSSDQQILTHFLSFGEVVERSVVTFGEDNRIRVISGPLKGLDGRIIKVDRRKGRARVRLEMYEDTFAVDLGFDLLEPQAEKGPPG